MPAFLEKSHLVSGNQAQQTHRFLLRVKGIDAALIQDVTVPSYSVETTDYDILEYKFRYPKKAKWDGKVTFTIIEMLDKDILTTTLGYFMSKLYDSAYYASPMGIGTGEKDLLLPNFLYTARSKASTFVNNGPNTGYGRKTDEGTVFDFSKQKLQAALGTVEIRTLDEEGRIFEAWRLNGSFITGIKPTNLSYTSEKISTITVDLSYDWADYGFRGVYAEEGSVLRVFGV